VLRSCNFLKFLRTTLFSGAVTSKQLVSGAANLFNLKNKPRKVEYEKAFSQVLQQFQVLSVQFEPQQLKQA